MNGKETRIAKIVFQKENKLEGICLLDSRAYIATVTKCVASAEGQTHVSKELLRTQKYAHTNKPDSDKSAKAIQRRKIAFSQNSARTTGHLQAK